MAINVKRIDLVQRFKDRDILKAPRTILDQVYINDTQKDDGTVEKGIEDTPAFIYNGKKPNNLNEALKNLAENVKGSIGASGVLQIKRGAAGTPEDPDLSGIYTMPEAGDADLGIVTLAKIKDLADEVDAAKDATRATVANKILTGVKADGTGEYYDIGTQMKNPASNKAFQGFEGGDITKPMWLEVKSTVAPAPFTGSTTIGKETYSSSDIGVASEFFYKLFNGNQLAIVESDMDPTSDNKYYAEWGGGANDAVTITIPKAEGKVKDVQINNTSIVDTDGNAKITVKDTYDAAGTDAISGKGVKDALDTLDVAEVGQAGKYIQKIKQEDGKITATLADVKDTYTATDTEPISGKGVADALSDLELEETGGTDKIITMVKQEDGKVTATAKTAVEKVAAPAATNAYEYKIADASVKVELPKATDIDYGEILLDKDKIDSASTAKTDDPKLMTGKAIEDSLAVKKVNGNASIYAYNSTVPAVDNAIVLGAGATATAEGAVVVGSGASAASKNDVAIGAGAATAADGGIAIGENATAAATKAISMGLGAQARSESSIAIGTAAKSVKEAAIALGSNINTTNAGEIAVGQYNITYTDDDEVVATAFTIGDGDITKAHNLIEQKQNADLYIPGIGGFDGTNSSPYDYELDDEGNPKINNDGNPIKKVRPLQESIVEDVVYMKPKPKEVVTLTSETRTLSGFNGDYFPNAQVIEIPGDVPSTMPGPITVNAPDNAGQSIPLHYGFLVTVPSGSPMSIPAGTYFLGAESASYVDFGSNGNATALFANGEMSDDGYQEALGNFAMFGMTAHLCIVGGNDEFGSGEFTTTIEQGGSSGGGGEVSVEITPIASNKLLVGGIVMDVGRYDAAKPLVSTIDITAISQYASALKNEMMLVMTVGDESESLPLSMVGYTGQPVFELDWTTSFAALLSWDLLDEAVGDTSQLKFSLGAVINTNDVSQDMIEEIRNGLKITSNYAGSPESEELIEVSIIKEHKGTLPFIDEIKDDSEDYDVPNVKAVKQVRKEIEDEFVFVKGSGDKSIKSKAGAAVASGKYAFATQALEMRLDDDVVTQPSIASGDSSVAMIGGEASGNCSFAIQGGKANGLQSTAIGNNAETSELYAVAIGLETQASGVQAIAIGSHNKASAMCSMAMGKSSEATKEYANALGYYAKAKGMYSTAIGKYVTVTNKNSMAVGLENVEHSDSTYGSEDATLFAIGHGTDMGVNAQEITYDGKMYINGIGGYDGIADDPDKWGAYKKNADGTDYINPLTNKNEHEYYKPLQEVIELMDARIKYLEDIIDQLTQQRNPVEP